MATVRIVHVAPRPGPFPDGSVRVGQFVIVLADADAKAAGTEMAVGRRALSLVLQVPGGHALWQLLERPAGDAVMAGVLEETAARLLGAAGVSVTGVELQVTDPDALELHSANLTASIELGTAGGTRHIALSAGYGLALAAASGAPVQVADAVMNRLAVPLRDDDAPAPFVPVAAAEQPARRAQRWRFEPRNLAFTDGLDRWELHGDAGRAHLQDYSCVAGRRSVTLACTVPEPHGCAVLVQTVFADDYRGRPVTFHGELRTQDVTGHAGLHLATGRPDEPPGAHLYRRGTSSLTAAGSSDWTRYEVAAQVPGDAEVVRFGLSLTGCGCVELRNAHLSAGA